GPAPKDTSWRNSRAPVPSSRCTTRASKGGPGFQLTNHVLLPALVRLWEYVAWMLFRSRLENVRREVGLACEVTAVGSKSGSSASPDRSMRTLSKPNIWPLPPSIQI